MPERVNEQACRPSLESREPLLSVEDLRVEFHGAGKTVHAVQGASWMVRRGETLGIVGESGSGKSVTALSIMGLIPITGRIRSGSYKWRGQEVDRRELSRMRGSRISMVFQDPMTSLDPLQTVGRQVGEVLRRHNGMGRRQARSRALELFQLVGIQEPERRLRQYPFQFSGGMAQRVMIAIALAPEPDLLIADEPTTALDVTIQAQILEVIASIQRRLGISVILITHDLGVVAAMAERVAVMYAGRVVETGLATDIFEKPAHPYTAGLIAATPKLHEYHERLAAIPGSPPVVNKEVPGCAFADRCAYSTAVCLEERPELLPLLPMESGGHDTVRKVACWHAL